MLRVRDHVASELPAHRTRRRRGRVLPLLGSVALGAASIVSGSQAASASVTTSPPAFVQGQSILYAPADNGQSAATWIDYNRALYHGQTGTGVEVILARTADRYTVTIRQETRRTMTYVSKGLGLASGDLLRVTMGVSSSVPKGASPITVTAVRVTNLQNGDTKEIGPTALFKNTQPAATSWAKQTSDDVGIATTPYDVPTFFGVAGTSETTTAAFLAQDLTAPGGEEIRANGTIFDEAHPGGILTSLAALGAKRDVTLISAHTSSQAGNLNGGGVLNPQTKTTVSLRS
jgi:hypothetical protein